MEVSELPNLLEAADLILRREALLLKKEVRPRIIVETNPSAIHKPLVEYFNDYDCRKFIAVRLLSRDPLRPEKFAFKPNMRNRMLLFRGQSSFYDPSTPSLLRKKEGRFVLENIYYEEFILALKDHPLVQLFYSGIELCGHRYFFEVNFYGLAQHYGLKTAVMDLTSDIDVAKFFAVTDSKDDEYYPVTDENRFGVLYYWESVRDNNAFVISPSGCNLSNIGLQLFPRSGLQRGFLFSMTRGENFNNCPFVKKVLFRHNAEISKQIFKDARKGRKYFPDDELSSLAERIRKSTVLSGEAFINNLRANPGDDYNKNFRDCKSAGVEIAFGIKHITFTNHEKAIYRKRINDGFWTRFCSQIVFPNDVDGKVMQEFKSLPNNPKYKRYFDWK